LPAKILDFDSPPSPLLTPRCHLEDFNPPRERKLIGKRCIL
jgi:hypothetical protein